MILTMMMIQKIYMSQMCDTCSFPVFQMVIVMVMMMMMIMMMVMMLIRILSEKRQVARMCVTYNFWKMTMMSMMILML